MIVLRDFLYCVMLFLPGILLMFVLSKRLGLRINLLEKILFGSIVWNFLLVSSSTLLGYVANFMIGYFEVFILVSGLVSVGSLAILIREQKPRLWTKIKISRLTAIYGVGFACFLVLSVLAIFFHNIFVEWDTLYCYIPSAKAVQLSGGLTTNPYRMLDFSDVSPGMPMMYALMLNGSDLNSLYTLPLSFFVLTIIVILLLSSKIFKHNFAWTTLIVFMSLPTVIMTISSRALYLDIAFLFYTLTALYVSLNLFNECKNRSSKFQCIMLGMSFALMLLTKIEIGVLLAPVAISIFFSAQKRKNWEIVSVLLVGSPYYLQEIWNILRDSASWTFYAQNLIPVLLMSGFVFAILKLSFSENTESMISGKQLVFGFSIVFLPAICYLARNILVSGFVYPGFPLWNAEIATSLTFFDKIVPPPTRGLSELMQWHSPLSVWWFIAPYIVPAAAAIISALLCFSKRKMRLQGVPFLLFFLGIFTVWSQLGCDTQPRRLYYLAPFAALAITYGFYKIRRFYNTQMLSLRILTFAIAVTLIISMRNGVNTVNDLALLYGALYRQNAMFELLAMLAISAVLFLVIFAPYELLVARIKPGITLSKRATTVVLSSFLLMNVGIFSILASPMLADVAANGFELRYRRYSGWYYYPDVVNYYKENITDQYTTLGFYCNELITFANRTVIDLYLPVYSSPIYAIIEKANATEILEVFRRLNVGYFLKPKPNNPFYSTYEKLMNSTILGNIFIDNPQFRVLEDFTYATLYKFYENYTVHGLTYKEIDPWNYNPGTNYTLNMDHNLTEFSGTTNSVGRISIMYVLQPPLVLDNALWIVIRSRSDAKLVVTLFSNLQNRSTAFFSFECQLDNKTRRALIDINEGSSSVRLKEDFDPTRVEGLLIGIETIPNHAESFEILGIYMIAY